MPFFRPALVFLPGLFVGALTPCGTQEPPSSLAPPPAPATLRVSYHHAVTSECTRSTAAPRTTCIARSVTAAAETKITVRPLRKASLRGREDQRQAITLLVKSDQDGDLVSRSLEPGHWMVDWPGYERRPSFDATASATLRMRLDDIAGRCAASGADCRLISSSTERHVEVSGPE